MSPALPLRWGILGSANIARKNWKAIADSGNGRVTVVASRDAERARRFIAECQKIAPFDPVPRGVGGYAELIASPDVDAVYVPIPTGLRRDWVVRAAQAGKHVVSEKPCAPTVADLEAMISACHWHGVQFMDGVMFQHSERLKEMTSVLRDGRSVGPVRRIDSGFCFSAGPAFFKDNIRADSTLEPLGCLGDLGWYCIRIILWAMDHRLPKSVTGRIISQRRGGRSPGAVPTDFSAELLFGDEVSAGFFCSFLTEGQNWAMVAGPNGCLQVNDFTLPRAGADAGQGPAKGPENWGGFQVDAKPSPRRYPAPEGSGGSQEARMFRDFANQVHTGRLNDFWPEIALKTQRVLNAALDAAKRGVPVEL